MRKLGIMFLFIYLDPMRPAPKLSPDYEYLYKMGGFLNWMGPDMVQFIDLLVVFQRETTGSGVPHFRNPKMPQVRIYSASMCIWVTNLQLNLLDPMKIRLDLGRKKTADNILYIYIYIKYTILIYIVQYIRDYTEQT